MPPVFKGPAPPPMPPPAPQLSTSSSSQSGGGLAAALAGASLKSAGQIKPKDTGSDLLNSIRQGISLKAVESTAPKAPIVQDNSVSAILSRRIAIAVSDDEEDDEEEWSD